MNALTVKIGASLAALFSLGLASGFVLEHQPAPAAAPPATFGLGENRADAIEEALARWSETRLAENKALLKTTPEQEAAITRAFDKLGDEFRAVRADVRRKMSEAVSKSNADIARELTPEQRKIFWQHVRETMKRTGPSNEEDRPVKSVMSVAKTDEKPKVAANEADKSAAAKTSLKSSEEPKSLDGEWKWSQRSATGGSAVERRLKLTLKNGKLEGTVFGGQFGQFKVPDAEIVSGEFKDGRITFVTGNERTTKYEGVVEGDSIKGTVDGPGRDGTPMKREWNATRAQ